VRLLNRPHRKGRILHESEFFMKNIRGLLLVFLGICLSALAGAQTGAKLLVTTDMDCNWKFDGQPMDPLKAHDSKVIQVSPGEHLIEAATTDEVATFRTTFNTTIPTKIDVEMGKFWVAIQLGTQHDWLLKRQHDETAGEPAKAGATLNSTWTDPATGLMWTKKDNGSDVNWNQASAYCSNLQLAGYIDWRLPTIEELQGIDDPNISSHVVFDNGSEGSVHVKGNLKLTGGHPWSSTQGAAPGKPYQVVWSFHFGQEKALNSTIFFADSRALCVRRSGE